MRTLLAATLCISLTIPAAATTIKHWKAYFSEKGLTLATSKTVKLNTLNHRNYVVDIKEHELVRQMAQISKTSAREEAYIHLSDRVALETGKDENFQVSPHDCLARATVQSSITIDDLISAFEAPPLKIVWYHVHPSRDLIDAQFRRSGCRPPSTWPILPSSADLSWFFERARKYYAASPRGIYMDRIVVHPLGVIELSLTDKGKAAVSQFEWLKNYTTQESGNSSMPGYRIFPQRVLQILSARIDRFKTLGKRLDAEIRLIVAQLSTDILQIRFIPMRQFQAKPTE